jgi:hypothetical protein
MVVPRAEPFVARNRDGLLRVTAIWCAMGVVLFVLTPRLSPVLLVLATIAPVAWCLADARPLAWQRVSPLTVAFVLAGIYLCFNASWSLSPSSAHAALGMFFALVAVLHIVLNALDQDATDVLRAMARGLVAGMLIAGTVMCLEVLSRQWIGRTVMSLLPGLQPNPRDMLVRDGWVIHLETYLLNRSITVLALLFWPTLLALRRVSSPGQRPYLLAGLALVVAAIFGSNHATSKIAFIGAAISFAALALWPSTARRGVAWGWTAIIMLVIPVATLMYQSQLYLATWLPRSAQHRIVIWGYTTQLLGKTPIFGAGIDAARAHNDLDSYDAPFAPDSDFRVTTGHHSHNVYLQTWYETGAVGALILLGIGLLVCNSLRQASREAQPYLTATFVTCALLGCSSFSLWQAWFMASLGLTAAFAMMGAVLDKSNS